MTDTSRLCRPAGLDMCRPRHRPRGVRLHDLPDRPRRFAPIALARAGLEGRWEHVEINRLSANDLPCLMPIMDGGTVIVTSVEPSI